MFKEIVGFVDRYENDLICEESDESKKWIPKLIYEVDVELKNDGNFEVNVNKKEYNKNLNEIIKYSHPTKSTNSKAINSNSGLLAMQWCSFYPFNNKKLVDIFDNKEEVLKFYKYGNKNNDKNNKKQPSHVLDFVLYDSNDKDWQLYKKIKDMDILSKIFLNEIFNQFYDEYFYQIFGKIYLDVVKSVKNDSKLRNEINHSVFLYINKKSIQKIITKYYPSLEKKFAEENKISDKEASELQENLAKIMSIKDVFDIRNKYKIIFNKTDPHYFKQDRCSICGANNVVVSVPNFLTTYQRKKPFLEHKTLINSEKSLTICEKCSMKINLFFDYLYSKGIKIFPLFVNPKLQSEEIKLINQENKNTFSMIFSEISSKTKRNIFNFYLVIYSGNQLLYFDYIYNYCWKEHYHMLGYTPRTCILKLFNHFSEDISIFFSDLNKNKRFKNRKKLLNLIYRTRGMLFDYVYRGRRMNISQEEYKMIICEFMDEEIQFAITERKPINKENIYNYLLLFLNGDVLLIGGGDPLISIDEVKNKIEELKNKKPSNLNINDLELPYIWAYSGGIIYRFLVNARKGDQRKKPLELEPIINVSSTEKLKEEVIRKLEIRSSVLNLNDLKLYESLLNFFLYYTPKISIHEIKPYFYAGYFDSEFSKSVETKKKEVE